MGKLETFGWYALIGMAVVALAKYLNIVPIVLVVGSMLFG